MASVLLFFDGSIQVYSPNLLEEESTNFEVSFHFFSIVDLLRSQRLLMGGKEINAYSCSFCRVALRIRKTTPTN